MGAAAALFLLFESPLSSWGGKKTGKRGRGRRIYYWKVDRLCRGYLVSSCLYVCHANAVEQSGSVHPPVFLSKQVTGSAHIDWGRALSYLFATLSSRLFQYWDGSDWQWKWKRWPTLCCRTASSFVLDHVVLKTLPKVVLCKD